MSGSRRSRVENEVLVRFVDVADRDVVQSYAPNLAKKEGRAGIRIEIPMHLRQASKLLDSHSAELKRMHPGAKRYMKFDDITKNLALDVKLSERDE